jgi:N-acetylglucosaminyldiphosphoundecaprenol N-acetyl-beta-D-mannosaminyltransferase
MDAIDLPTLLLADMRLTALRRCDLLSVIHAAVEKRKPALIFHHNLHSLYLYRTNDCFRRCYEHATHIYADGLPVIWMARTAGLPVTSAHRITLLDYIEDFMAEAAASRWRVFYLGGAPDVINAGTAALRERIPHLVIKGHHGFFSKTGPESAAVIKTIRDFRPDVLFVGMGMPIQEQWLVDNKEAIDVPAALTCGATLEYVTGHSYRPPMWAGQLGLYGAFRLLAAPRRLWRRYLFEPIALTAMLLPELIAQRHYHKTPCLQSALDLRYEGETTEKDRTAPTK